MAERKCLFCNPEIDTIMKVAKPTLSQVEAIIEATEATGQMLGCGVSKETICVPLMRFQRAKDKIIKEINS